ncbi:MAG TPA: GspE/PulE family protein [Candidatus Tyrphobacter sp.]|nr:GspE/PulE family protein [Candidatus Tyrphobacter sp.]
MAEAANILKSAIILETDAAPKSVAEAGKFFEEKLANRSDKDSTTSLLSLIFSLAAGLRASDVHFEPAAERVRLRFRSDGILYDIAFIPRADYALIVSRIKLISGLKLNVSDSPQDGRFSMEKGSGGQIDARVSVIPSEYGETAVIRLLDPAVTDLNLTDIGLRPDELALTKEILKKPNGMILVTGPTGSGKTTTLYAFLKRVKNPGLKIITIEDPIEYRLEGIEQTQVDSSGKYDFNNGLASILRQDPDVILVGEIRDKETAEIALQASLTGHLVFSTLHTNNAPGAITRLIDLEINPSTIGPALNLVIAQRLVRKLCPDCRKRIEPAEADQVKIKDLVASLPQSVKAGLGEDVNLYEPVGCSKCEGGFRGRLGIFEFLVLDGDFQGLIKKEATEGEIRKLALEKGMIEMQNDGIIKALQGLTSLSEVERETGPVPLLK